MGRGAASASPTTKVVMPPTASAGFLPASPVLHDAHKGTSNYYNIPPYAGPQQIAQSQNRSHHVVTTPNRTQRSISVSAEPVAHHRPAYHYVGAGDVPTHHARHAGPAAVSVEPVAHHGPVYHYVGAGDAPNHHNRHTPHAGRSQSHSSPGPQRGNLVPSYVSLTPRQAVPSQHQNTNQESRPQYVHEQNTQHYSGMPTAATTPRSLMPAAAHHAEPQAHQAGGRSQSAVEYYPSARTGLVMTPRGGGGGGSRGHTPDPHSRPTTPHSYLPSIEIPEYRPVMGENRYAAGGRAGSTASTPGSRTRSASPSGAVSLS